MARIQFLDPLKYQVLMDCIPEKFNVMEIGDRMVFDEFITNL